MAGAERKKFRVYFVDGNYIDIEASGFEESGRANRSFTAFLRASGASDRRIDQAAIRVSEVRAIVAHDRLGESPDVADSQTAIPKADG